MKILGKLFYITLGIICYSIMISIVRNPLKDTKLDDLIIFVSGVAGGVFTVFALEYSPKLKK